MRLVCPNCKAEYEVDDSAIPPTGRDVQCSACSHIWLQAPAGGWPEETDADTEDPWEPGALGDPGEQVPTADAADAQSNLQLSKPLEAEPEPEVPADEASPETPRGAPAEDAEDKEPPGPDGAMAQTGGADAEQALQVGERPPRRNPAASPEVIAILREEAERETKARRRGSAAALEVQSDLGLTDAPPPRPEPSGEDAPPSPPRGLNRLPAIDEIDTASLRPAPRRSSRGSPGAAPVRTPAAAVPGGGTRRRGRYLAGFLLSAAIATAAALVYVRAGDIAAALPEAGPALDAYATWVEGLRLRLDDVVRAAVEAISAFAARAGA